MAVQLSTFGNIRDIIIFYSIGINFKLDRKRKLVRLNCCRTNISFDPVPFICK